MSTKRGTVLGCLVLAALALLLCERSLAQQATSSKPAPTPSTTATSNTDLLAEGEKRFHANCGRCHQPPHKLPPRLILTVERHMRVRATLTEEDMRAIVAYLTQ
jgi:mono/diheme cytochrome c family protein